MKGADLTPAKSPKVVYLTSGAAGMYCGSCLNDNTLARALLKRSVDIQLVPTYTPIRTDEPDVATGPVFLGGVNVFLEQQSAIFRRLPAWLRSWMDGRRFLNFVTRRAMNMNPRVLGALTVSMLQGTSGNQSAEVQRLVDWLEQHARPNIVHLSNLLIGGCLPEIRRRLAVRTVVTLQGDDIFLDSLSEPFQSQAVELMRSLVPAVDRFLVHSHYYQHLMQERLRIPERKIQLIPLTIDVSDLRGIAHDRTVDHNPQIGYLARLAPEKGLAQLVDAFIALTRLPGMGRVQLRIAGWLGSQHRDFADEQFAKLQQAGLQGRWEYVGEVDRAAKCEFLRSLDLFCVPATYREPKGLYVLEALAAGVPVVLPNHGAFPELLHSLHGGRLVQPHSPQELAQLLAELIGDSHERQRLAEIGRQNVLAKHCSEVGAEQLARIYGELLSGPAS